MSDLSMSSDNIMKVLDIYLINQLNVFYAVVESPDWFGEENFGFVSIRLKDTSINMYYTGYGEKNGYYVLALRGIDEHYKESKDIQELINSQKDKFPIYLERTED